jgi:hypothetical protein
MPLHFFFTSRASDAVHFLSPMFHGAHWFSGGFVDEAAIWPHARHVIDHFLAAFGASSDWVVRIVRIRFRRTSCWRRRDYALSFAGRVFVCGCHRSRAAAPTLGGDWAPAFSCIMSRHLFTSSSVENFSIGNTRRQFSSCSDVRGSPSNKAPERNGCCSFFSSIIRFGFADATSQPWLSFLR